MINFRDRMVFTESGSIDGDWGIFMNVPILA